MKTSIWKLTQLPAWLVARARSERGDVPGWVLITLMTAGLVLLLWGVAGETLVSIFQESMKRVGIIGG
ncbi:hypothetical protein SAMN02910418_01087 [Bowdeniella nasicola]|uniref:Uncharacterized protein n=1 Tax=Bowdeniella nasicola TaxID=208480 RepID=A0A1H3Z2P3_9ACTO|nr:hypothetical protein [Bowdeniella nasicola]SEA18123.1 hypothetical protein SAMN02910418_01087 [Bowdeniella nasicola]